jgi:O-antigen/teichoic acid export membrane protein/glycosyltransferase involved in cell wall biosynthesis
MKRSRTDDSVLSGLTAQGVSSIGRQVARGAGWMVMLRMANRVLGVISFCILARILVPEDFGLVALAGSLGGLLEIISEFSVELALIRASQNDRRLYDSAWTIKIVRGLAVSVVLVLLASTIARFFDEPRIEAVVYFLALASFILSFENIGVVEFRKSLAFEKEFTYLFLGRCISTVVTVVLALMWRNYWVLIAGTLTSSVTRVALSYVVHDYRPRVSFGGFGELFQFSKWMVITNCVHGLNQRMPGWVIGRLAGVGAVAHYEVASTIATLTTSELRMPIRAALYPGFVKMAADRKKLRKSFFDAYGLMALIGLPIPIMLALTAPLLIQVFLGHQWQAAGPVIEVLALYGIVQALGSSSHLVYLAINRPSLTTQLVGLYFILLCPLLVTGAILAGAVGAAWALTITSIIVLVVDFAVVFKVLEVGPQRIFSALARPVAGSVTMLAGLLPLRLFVPATDSWIGSVLQLTTLAVSGSMLYVSAVFALWHLAGRPESAERHILSVLQETSRRLLMKVKRGGASEVSQDPSAVPSVIVFGLNEWNDNWQTRQYISTQLGKRGWSVVYSTGAGDSWERGTAAWDAKRWNGYVEERDHVQFYRSGKLDVRCRRVKAWNQWALRRHARKLMELAGWSMASHRIAYIFHPTFWPYIEYLGDCTVVYHADDAFSLMPGWNRNSQAMESQLVARANLLLASSPGIARQLPNGGAQRARSLPNGALVQSIMDLAQCPCPSDLSSITHPRIGYVGSINIKVDLLLVAEIARRRPDWHWVLIGPVMSHRHEGFPGYAEFQAGLAACAQLENVHFLGAKPYYLLPSYTTHMDVNTMCYRNVSGGWWTAIYPLKLHEYLAAGKPIVGTNLEVLQEFRSVVAIAETAEEWLRALSVAVHAGGMGTKHERQSVAAQNSWDSRGKVLVGWLEDVAAIPRLEPTSFRESVQARTQVT